MQTAGNKLSFFNAQRFAKNKPANTFRVFCLGGSTTFGRPYDDRTSYVGWLRELLPLADVERHWEIINAGGISYASYRIASVMEELLEYSPDLFIIYTGHNEFLEERTYRDQTALSPALRRATAALHRSRTYSLAHRLLTSEPSNSEVRSMLPAEVDAILDHSVGPDAYQRDDRLRSQILEHFEFNLKRMVQTARSAGADVLLVTPAANLKDFSPLKSMHHADLEDEERQQWSELFESSAELAAEGNTKEALAILKAAVEIDSGHADLHFRLGRLLMDQQRFAEARVSFQRAIDNDICPLRAIPGIQRLVEQTAVSDRVPLVDFDGILMNDCLETYGHCSPGREYFLDHVHPSIAAHRLLALAIVEAMTRGGTVTPSRQWGEEAIALVSRRIESRIDVELQTRALTNLAQVLSWAGKQEEAGPLAEQAVRLRSKTSLNQDPESMFYAAVNCAINGRDEEATQLLEKVVELEPRNHQARWRLAALLYDQLRYEEAELHFCEAVRLDPHDAYSYQMLGAVLLKLERYEESLAASYRASELAPDNTVVRSNIKLLLKKVGRS